ncbi:hypothetical protein Tco_1208604 [Tanacetum coccineum]
MGPLGLNKLITFKVLCRSLQIEPTVTLFRVFQTLCKQAGYSGCYGLKKWTKLLTIKTVYGSFTWPDVRRVLSTHVVKLRDMPEVMGIHDFPCLSKWTGVEVQEEPHLDVRSTLQRLTFYCTPPVAVDAVIPVPALEDLTVGTPSSKIGDSDDESDGDDDACVEIMLVTPLCSAVVIPPSGNQGRSLAAPATEGSNTRYSWGKGIMVDDAATPSGGVSRPRPSSRPAPSFKDVSGDAIHTDFFPFSAGPYYATYPKGGIAGNSKFTREEWDAPYRPTFGVLTKEVFKDPAVCKTVVDQFPTLGEMVRIESLSDDQLTTKMSVLHLDSRLNSYEEKVANMTKLELQVAALKKQVSGLNDKLTSSDASFAKSKAKGKERKKKIKSLGKSVDNLHAEVSRLSASLNQATILEVERDEEIFRLKTTRPEFSSFFRGQFQVLDLSMGLSMHRTKDEFAAVLKKKVDFIPGVHDRLAEASPFVAQTDYAFLNKISKHATEPLSVILKLEPKKLARPTNVPTLRDTHVSLPIAKESTVTPVYKSLELSINVVPASSVVASEWNEEQVYAAVDGSDLEMADSAIPSKSEGVFVHEVSRILDDVVGVVAVESERVSSGPTDVVVALSVDGKGDVLIPSSVAGEEVVINSFGV